MVWTELHVTAGRAQWKPLFSSFLETASPARLLCIGFFHSSRKQKTIELKVLFVFFWSWPTCALVHWGTAVLLGVSQGADAEWYCKDAQVQSFLSPSKQTLTVLSLHLCPAEAAVTCPDREPELEVWNPGHNEENRVEIRNGRKVLLSSSATVHSIHITDGGKTCCSKAACTLLSTGTVSISGDRAGRASCWERGGDWASTALPQYRAGRQLRCWDSLAIVTRLISVLSAEFTQVAQCNGQFYFCNLLQKYFFLPNPWPNSITPQ